MTFHSELPQLTNNGFRLSLVVITSNPCIASRSSEWGTKIDSIRNAKIPTHCFKDEIPTGLNLTEYLEGLNIFDPEDLLNTLLRKIAVEPVPKKVQWWEAQGRFENLIEAEFRRGGDYQAVLR